MSEGDPAEKHAKRMEEKEKAPKKPVDYRQVSLLGLAIVAVAGLIWWIVFNLIR